MRHPIPAKDSEGWFAGPGIVYRCGLCRHEVPSLPPTSVGCPCGNIYIDVGYGRLSVRDESKIEAFADGPPPN